MRLIRRRPIIMLLLSLPCIVALGSLQSGGYTAAWSMGSSDTIEFAFAPVALYQVPLAILAGPGEIKGHYSLNAGSSDGQQGSFKLLRDHDGYVTGYVLTDSHGHESRWTSEHCEFLKDDAGNAWSPSGGQAPIRISTGLIASVVEAL